MRTRRALLRSFGPQTLVIGTTNRDFPQQGQQVLGTFSYQTLLMSALPFSPCLGTVFLPWMVQHLFEPALSHLQTGAQDRVFQLV